MPLSVLDLHLYNNLIKSDQVHNVIFCPFDKDDIVVTRVDEDDMPYFYCISCKTTFRVGNKAKEYIKLSIDKFKSRV